MKIEDRMLSPLIVRHGNINSSFVPLYAVAANGKSLYEVKGRETCGQREILWVKSIHPNYVTQTLRFSWVPCLL